jgi:hypothetical protein
VNEERERPPDEDEGLSEEELAQESGEAAGWPTRYEAASPCPIEESG